MSDDSQITDESSDEIVDESGEDTGRLDENESIVRAKWVFDGADTLSEAAAMLRAYAETLEAMEADGWQLTGPVTDDYGYIAKRTN